MSGLSFELTSSGEAAVARHDNPQLLMTVLPSRREKIYIYKKKKIPSFSWLWRCWRCEARPRGCPPRGVWRTSPWWSAAPCLCPVAGGRRPGRASGSGKGAAPRRGSSRNPLCTAASGASGPWSPRPASHTETAARWTTPERRHRGLISLRGG